ncbi:MAG: HAMP domain-containing protein [Thermomicrobiales bacterium]
MITAHVIGLLVVVATVGVSATFLFDSTHDFEQLGLILAFAVAVAAIYSSFISGWFTSPLNELAGASRLLAEGDVTIRLPDAGEKELADLGLAMNTMAGRLQFAYQRQRTLEESQRYLVAAVISELQEPLSSLDRGSAMLIASQEPGAALVRRIAAGMQRDWRASRNCSMAWPKWQPSMAGRSPLTGNQSCSAPTSWPHVND